MRQTVVIVTALMIALLAVSGFIVAGSVEQMRQLTEQSSLKDELEQRSLALAEQLGYRLDRPYPAFWVEEWAKRG